MARTTPVRSAPFDVSRLEDLAVRAEGRAARARRHALMARARAGRKAAEGDRAGETLYRLEAEGHERAANANEQTAALYRRRAMLLTDRGPRTARAWRPANPPA